MLFSVNKGRDDLHDSLLIMSEKGNGNEVDNGEMTRSQIIGNIYLYIYVYVCAKVDVSTCIRVVCIYLYIEDLILESQSSIVCSFSNLLLAIFISGPERNRINRRTKSDQGRSTNLCAH